MQAICLPAPACIANCAKFFSLSPYFPPKIMHKEENTWISPNTNSMYVRSATTVSCRILLPRTGNTTDFGSAMLWCWSGNFFKPLNALVSGLYCTKFQDFYPIYCLREFTPHSWLFWSQKKMSLDANVKMLILRLFFHCCTKGVPPLHIWTLNCTVHATWPWLVNSGTQRESAWVN